MNGTLYRYRARTAQGELVRGRIEAASVDEVLDSLRTRALFITAVEPESGLTRSVGASLHLGRPARRALLAFFRSFATLLRAGVPLRRALDVTIARASDRALAEALRSILADIERGISLSDAFGRRPRVFPPLYVAMIRAGEAGGILDEVLERLATLLEREADLRKKVRAALAYPVIVVTAAAALTVFLLVRIVPMFAEMFDAFHVDVPPSTRLLLDLAAVMQRPSTWIAGGIALCAATTATVWSSRTAAGARTADRARLTIPIVGSLMHKAITARIARMLATLLRAGVELVAAIDVVRPVAGSPVYEAALQRIDRSVREGGPLTAALAASRIFDPLAVALIGIGEETGLLDDMLLKLAVYFEADVEAAIATLGAAFEPALIGGLGLVVGFIVFSVFIPLYSLIGSISK
ncbi:MAG: Type secretion system domain protein [Candidatus Eremiobacteraeota bacterium]|nr:Type secretion system domain protein [Candidatus Eremiobacteraeota bacterium]